jgi:hypothetical protein
MSESSEVMTSGVLVTTVTEALRRTNASATSSPM